MPSTPSPLLNLELQQTGEGLSVWGDKLNGLFRQTEQAIASAITLTIAGNRTLTANLYAENEYRRAALILVADPTLAAAFAITVPKVSKLYWVVNATLFPATWKTADGTGAVVRPGRTAMVICDGADCRVSDPTLDQIKAPAAALVMNGQKITGQAAGTDPTDSATLSNRLDQFAAPNVNIANGAAASQQPATVKQVETLINASSGPLFPVQSGHAGEVLTTDGTNPRFKPISGFTLWAAMIS